MAEPDPKFYDRADEHIRLSNKQINEEASRGKVSASMLYATSRFNAWISACWVKSGEEMAAHRAETIDYFVKQFREMLEENVDDYIEHFDKYMKIEGDK